MDKLETGAQAGAAGETAAPPRQPAPIVDFDAGGVWESETLTLWHPFRLRGAAYENVKVRVPSGNDLVNWMRDGFDRVNFASAITGLDDLTLKAMHGEDFNRVMKAAGSFLL
jgi:hypothetical protein